ncbi:MAG: Swt1 family HEPN domain-containing protein [Thermoplasmata archaeon]
MAKGKRIELRQVPKAERDLAVAAASILARDMFLRKRDDLCESYGIEFPKGASNVVEFGKKLVEDHGIEILPNVAKVHFGTTEDITGGLIPKIPDDVEKQVSIDRVPRSLTDREKEDERLECYNLISTFEGELRDFISKELHAQFGDSWWEERIPSEVRGKAERLAEAERKKGREVRPVNGLDFSHYEWILLDEKNWEKAFKRRFRNKDNVRDRLIVLKSYRDPVAHSRGEITPKEKGEVVGAISWLRKMMKSQANLEDFLKE